MKIAKVLQTGEENFSRRNGKNSLLLGIRASFSFEIANCIFLKFTSMIIYSDKSHPLEYIHKNSSEKDELKGLELVF